MREICASFQRYESQEQRINRDRGARIYQTAQKRALVLLFLSGRSSISRINEDDRSLQSDTGRDTALS